MSQEFIFGSASQGRVIECFHCGALTTAARIVLHGRPCNACQCCGEEITCFTIMLVRMMYLMQGRTFDDEPPVLGRPRSTDAPMVIKRPRSADPLPAAADA